MRCHAGWSKCSGRARQSRRRRSGRHVISPVQRCIHLISPIQVRGIDSGHVPRVVVYSAICPETDVLGAVFLDVADLSANVAFGLFAVLLENFAGGLLAICLSLVVFLWSPFGRFPFKFLGGPWGRVRNIRSRLLLALCAVSLAAVSAATVGVASAPLFVCR